MHFFTDPRSQVVQLGPFYTTTKGKKGQLCVSQGQTQLESCAVMSLSLLKLQMFKFQVCPCPCDTGKTKPTPGLDFDGGFTKLVFNLNEDI